MGAERILLMGRGHCAAPNDASGIDECRDYLRSVVTTRTGCTPVFQLLRCKQAASMVGQCCAEQDKLAERIGSRSDLASGRGALASTGGARLGKIVKAAAARAAIVTAESALIIDRPPAVWDLPARLQGRRARVGKGSWGVKI